MIFLVAPPYPPLHLHPLTGFRYKGLIHLFVCFVLFCFYTCMREQGVYVIEAGVRLYYPKTSLNGTLVVDLPFQTLAVDF